MTDHRLPGDGDLKTIRDFLRWGVSKFNAAGLSYGHGTGNAFDEAAFLILETLHLPVDRLDPFLDARPTAAERRLLTEILDLRVQTRKPASYLTGTAYIQGVRFRVDERVLVPRSFIGEMIATGSLGPEGIGLIPDFEEIRAVLDIGTGSGCLAILAAMAFPNARVDAVDLSPAALELAAVNVDDHRLKHRIRLLEGDVFAPVGGQRYDLIIANPPYVSAKAMAELPPEFRSEPASALAGGEDGLDIVRRILAKAGGHLTDDGALICEVGTGREILEAAYPDLEFLWLNSEESSGEVFWLAAAALRHARR